MISKLSQCKDVKQLEEFVKNLESKITSMGGRKFVYHGDQKTGGRVKTHSYSLNEILVKVRKLDPNGQHNEIRTILATKSKEASALLKDKSRLITTLHAVRHNLGKLVDHKAWKERENLPNHLMDEKDLFDEQFIADESNSPLDKPAQDKTLLFDKAMRLTRKKNDEEPHKKLPEHDKAMKLSRQKNDEEPHKKLPEHDKAMKLSRQKNDEEPLELVEKLEILPQQQQDEIFALLKIKFSDPKIVIKYEDGRVYAGEVNDKGKPNGKGVILKMVSENTKLFPVDDWRKIIHKHKHREMGRKQGQEEVEPAFGLFEVIAKGTFANGIIQEKTNKVKFNEEVISQEFNINVPSDVKRSSSNKAALSDTNKRNKVKLANQTLEELSKIDGPISIVQIQDSLIKNYKIRRTWAKNDVILNLAVVLADPKIDNANQIKDALINMLEMTFEHELSKEEFLKNIDGQSLGDDFSPEVYMVKDDLLPEIEDGTWKEGTTRILQIPVTSKYDRAASQEFIETLFRNEQFIKIITRFLENRV